MDDADLQVDEPRRVVKIRHRKSTSESKLATMVMPLADAGVGVQDVTDFWASGRSCEAFVKKG